MSKTTPTVGCAVKPSYLRCEHLVDPLAIEKPHPRLSWVVAGAGAGGRGKAGSINPARGARQTAYRILVAASAEALSAGQGDLWDSGQVASDQSIHVDYAGAPLKSRAACWWKVRLWDQAGQPSAWSKPAMWGMGLLRPKDWQAGWIGVAAETQHPATYLRREFSLRGKVKRAIVYASALGVYELRLNGQRVGDHVLAPEWTSYHNHVQYQAYDVTALLRAGVNAIGAILGDGWYAGRLGLAHTDPDCPMRGIYGKATSLLVQMHVQLAGGREQVIVSDRNWKATVDGPILSSDILDGESIDARRAMPGWDKSGFDDAQWQRVGPARRPDKRLVAQANEPIRIGQEIRPVEITQPKPGMFIVNLGQNIMGWARLKVRGQRGQIITLRHGERLQWGRLYTDNLRGTPQMEQYICSGDGVETFEPHFTYHGFQYVEIMGLTRPPRPDEVTGCAFWSSCPPAGALECSDAQLNKLYSNILWTQRDNMPGVPTDCPQRDERCGWSGDIQVFAQAGCFNMDMATFLTKWLRDLADDQAADGRFPDIAPQPYDANERFSGVPAWGDAGVIVPWRLWENYADRAALAQAYAPAQRWVEWIHRNNPGLLWANNRGNDYGEWLNADTFKFDIFPKTGGQMPKEVFATAFFHQSARMLAGMAAILDQPADAARYAALADDIRRAFNAAYVGPDGVITGDTQAGYAVALWFGLLDPALEDKAFAHMLRKFEPYNGHFSTGFIATVPLMLMLSRFGRSDKAYELLTQRSFPSWGYEIDQGATTTWERWDGYVEGKGYQDPGMNSFCHYALGAVAEWMYRTMLGINPDGRSPGYKHFIVKPIPGGPLTFARGHYDSIRGRIAVAWQLSPGRYELDVTVPPNTTATIFVRSDDPASVTESGQPATAGNGLAAVAQSGAGEAGFAVFEAQSGGYHFAAALAKP